MATRSASAALASPASAALQCKRGFASAAAAAQRSKVKDAQRIVIKVGTAVVAHGASGQLAMSRLGGLVEQIRTLSQDQRKQILLVSSGAVGLGRGALGMTKDDTTDSPSGLVNRQACAAMGQAMLMGTYTSMMGSLGVECAQVLITQNDFVCPERYGRLTSTLEALAMRGIVPIINENDVVTGGTELAAGESAFSDNDMLSALVAAGVRADAVAMMTDVDAVFDKPPTEAGAQRIAVFDRKQQVAIGAISAGGRGGMASKILAAQTAAAGGVHAVVANGHDLANITRVFEGTDVGTLFPGNKTRPSKLQHWLAHAAKSTNLKGKVSVSKSAAARMTNKCTTTEAPPLTMADILSTHGSFDSNTAIEITDDEGAPIGRGLIQLASSDLEQRPRNMQDMNVFLPKDMVFMPQAN